MLSSIGFTGTQRGCTPEQMESLEELLRNNMCPVFHYGDCVGADKQAFGLATYLGFTTISHPPIDSSKRAFTKPDIELKPKEYLERNKDIVKASDILIACPHGAEVMRSGTWSTFRYAKGRIGRYVIHTNGKIVYYPV